MNHKIRLIVVDPQPISRETLKEVIAHLGSFWLAESCDRYEAAQKAVAEHMPHLVVVSLDADPERALATIQSLAQSPAPPAILPVSKQRDGDMLLRLMRAGAREFLSLPLVVQEFLDAVNRLVHANPESIGGSGVSSVVAITGAMGGVGTTSVAVQLATAISKHTDQSVALLDFDMLSGAVDTCLDLVPDRTISEIAQSAERLDLTLLKRSLFKHPSGVHILPRPAALEEVPHLDPDAIRQVVNLLKASFSLVLIDTSKGLQPWDLIALELAETVLLVVQLDVICLRNTARLLQLFRQSEGMLERMKVVSNRADSPKCEISKKKAEEIIGLPISFEIPNSPWELHASRERGVTLDVIAPKSKIYRSFVDLAKHFQRQQESLAPSAPKTKKLLGRFAASFA
jgi:pilus assembly protein CpaE